MKIEEMTYNEAKWWIFNDWEFIEFKASEHFKKDVMLLYCEGTKNIFFADKKTGEPIHTYLYVERNKKIKRTRQQMLDSFKSVMNKRYENRINKNK
tara:strand:+ start:298 stop:585 length:288 start_codon:yes stop_codon:yes gene_type:complete